MMVTRDLGVGRGEGKNGEFLIKEYKASNKSRNGDVHLYSQHSRG
jgi:hypothetical protein